MAIITSNALANNTTDSSGAAYRCDTQGSSAHYLQFVPKNDNHSMFVCNRLTNRANYVGCRISGGVGQIFKRVASTFTQLGTNSAAIAVNDVVRLESSAADGHTLFSNTVSFIGPITDAFNNTEVRQGANARTSGAAAWLDNFEAGSLAAASYFAFYKTHAISDGVFRGLHPIEHGT
jgi:hypothetical protein